MLAGVQTSYLRVLPAAGLILAISLPAALAGPVSLFQSTSRAPNAHIVEAYGKIPLSFETNSGQVDKSVRFLARSSGYGLFLKRNQAELMLCKTASGAAQSHFLRKLSPNAGSALCDVVRMQLAGASSKVEPVGDEQLPGTVNYFIGRDPAQWRSNIPTYANVRYRDAYPGIDLLYYGKQGQIEFDFVVARGADPQVIRLRFGGVTRMHRTASGDLLVSTAHGTVTFHRPLVYQIVGGYRQSIAGSFTLLGKHTVGFQLGRYDRANALVIDPVLAFSTFLGGSSIAFTDQASAVAVDNSGNVYVAGRTSAANFPVTPGSFQTTNHGAANQETNAFISKLNPTGTALVYSTYLGGSGNFDCAGDTAYGLAVDSSGNAYVTGSTCSTDFPVTPGAFQTTNHAAANQSDNAFITKLNATGTALLYSTYLGGSGTTSLYPADRANAIAVDAAGDAYVTGQAFSTDFPVTPGAFQTTNNAQAIGASNAFAAELNSAGTGLVYSTYVGGSGGSSPYAGDMANAITVDAAGEAYLTGATFSSNFPVTPGVFQTTNNAVANQGTNAFLTKLNSTGSALVYSTYLGGSSGDNGNAIAVDSVGEAYVGGAASSTDFPVTQGAFQIKDGAAASGLSNAFITKLNPTGTALLYSTYLGGSGGVVNVTPSLLFGGGDLANGLAIDSSGNVYVTGSTASSNFPVTQNAYQATNHDQPPCAEGCIGGYNAFITELNSSGSALIYSTYLGGNGINSYDSVGAVEFGQGDQANALALDSSGNVYVAGSACSSDFPLTGGAFQTTIPSPQTSFIAKLNMSETSTAIAPTVTVAPTASSITSALPLMVTISVAGPTGAATPTGTVALASGTYFSPVTTLTGGSATIDVPGGALLADPGPACGLPPSPDILLVNYLPDAASSPTYESSSGLATVEVFALCLSTTPNLTTITTSQSQSQPFPIGIAATGGTGNPVPTGTVTLTSGGYSSAVTPLSGGNANISIPPNTFTQLGNNLVNVAYSGDSNYAPYPRAGAAIVIVTNASGIGFTIAGTAVTIKAGATTGNTSNITVTSAAGFIGDVTLTAAVTSSPSGAQNPPTFSFSPSPVVTGPALVGTSTLTINTTAATGCTLAQQTRGEIPWHTGGGAVLACMLLFGIPACRRSRKTVLGFLTLLILAGGFVACGSGSRSTCQGAGAGTTPGNYTITITGTSGLTTATGTVNLTVE